MDDTWGRRVVEAIAQHAHASNWNLLIGPRDVQRRLRLPRQWSGDGVIASLRDQSMARHLKQSGLPAVDVSITMPRERWLGRVATDDARRARMAFEHLRERGIERFACYSPPIGRYPDGRGSEFARVVEDAGYECQVFTTPSSRRGSGLLADHRRASAWLATLDKPIGIFASDAYPARQLAEVCERSVVRIPDDVALVAGDTDELLCDVARPQITSLQLACHRIGSEACRMLAGLMEGTEVNAEPLLLPPVRVVHRHSTDVLAIADEEVAEVLRFIRDNATRGIEVRDLLEEFPVSRRGLEVKFKRLVGRSPGAEMRRVRLEHARKLLLSTEQSIDSIARAVGMSGGPALSHAFRKHLGVTPGQLRERRT